MHACSTSNSECCVWVYHFRSVEVHVGDFVRGRIELDIAFGAYPFGGR